MPVSLSFDGFNPGFRLVRARRLRRRIYCLARSESCASVRSLGILGFSGCVRGFSMPKNSYLDNWAPVICTTCSLRWRSAASDPLAQNPNPQRVRKGFFMPKNRRLPEQGHKPPQMCFLLLFPFGACMLHESVVKFYSLPTQCVENIAGGFA